MVHRHSPIVLADAGAVKLTLLVLGKHSTRGVPFFSHATLQGTTDILSSITNQFTKSPATFLRIHSILSLKYEAN